ncbi:hypothetical protein SAMD00019534_062970 [Acytostelium subglobosum LB1]|uniref:hypothetical protein n=1 Tax=Acytostelium subglobosum LB1 TaxID=1410327 RepID=UPI0006449481|nr:hypothetical protein SAMD00019534_062970 [Acytostelium subglobosum LB1]GAM23122.1 hypothetical protein SAMD00019534_062970 [Acytostelium subglobosum LB1]|eukprot:XP_012754349.1 hypothetical protein SAMD00019534_062970 [Acytostelium subglobosum LB1]
MRLDELDVLSSNKLHHWPTKNNGLNCGPATLYTIELLLCIIQQHWSTFNTHNQPILQIFQHMDDHPGYTPANEDFTTEDSISLNCANRMQWLMGLLRTYTARNASSIDQQDCNHNQIMFIEGAYRKRMLMFMFNVLVELPPLYRRACNRMRPINPSNPPADVILVDSHSDSHFYFCGNQQPPSSTQVSQVNRKISPPKLVEDFVDVDLDGESATTPDTKEFLHTHDAPICDDHIPSSMAHSILAHSSATRPHITESMSIQIPVPSSTATAHVLSSTTPSPTPDPKEPSLSSTKDMPPLGAPTATPEPKLSYGPGVVEYNQGLPFYIEHLHIDNVIDPNYGLANPHSLEAILCAKTGGNDGSGWLDQDVMAHFAQSFLHDIFSRWVNTKSYCESPSTFPVRIHNPHTLAMLRDYPDSVVSYGKEVEIHLLPIEQDSHWSLLLVPMTSHVSSCPRMLESTWTSILTQTLHLKETTMAR